MRTDLSPENRQALARLQGYGDALVRADDKGYMDIAPPLYSALALVEMARALVEISDTLQRREAGA